MKYHNAKYIVGGTNIENFPESDLPEIMLCGRSNVGKSTFLNTLFGNKKLAKTSSNPGKTRVLNWFNVDEKFNFVDVPGYGYAKVGKREREAFGKMIEQYITTRENLRMVFLLLDYRHTPTDDDVMMIDFLNYYDIPITFILTKEDKIKRNDRKKFKERIMRKIGCADDNKIIPFSSLSKINIEKVEQVIENVIK